MTEYSYPEFFEAVVRLRGQTCWVETLLKARRAEAPLDVMGVGPKWKEMTYRGCDGPPDAHHLVSKQRIKREVSSRMPEFDLGAVLNDPRNGVICCRRHHDLLERRLVVPTRDELPEDAIEFAEEIGMGWSVERDYPAAA